MDKPNTVNGLNNDISSLFQKDFIRMLGFSKVQLRWKKINKNTNKKGVRLYLVRQERKGDIELKKKRHVTLTKLPDFYTIIFVFV